MTFTCLIRTFCLFVIFAVLTSTASTRAFADAIPPHRFMQVSPSLYRSAVPASDDNFEFYRAHGIQTIIDLRSGAEPRFEKARALAAGFRYVNIPLEFASTPADYARAEKDFFAFVDHAKASRGSIVFHCREGKDRTGLMAALYRVKRQAWSTRAAIEEWKKMGGFNGNETASIQAYFLKSVGGDSERSCANVFQ